MTLRTKCWPIWPFPRSTGARFGRTTLRKGSTRGVKRRTDVVGIFPNHRTVVQLVGAILAEQNDEWPYRPSRKPVWPVGQGNDLGLASPSAPGWHDWE
jgi:transposase-like protein